MAPAILDWRLRVDTSAAMTAADDDGELHFVDVRRRVGAIFVGSIGNLQYNLVPAPGALALLGVAGVVGADVLMIITGLSRPLYALL